MALPDLCTSPVLMTDRIPLQNNEEPDDSSQPQRLVRELQPRRPRSCTYVYTTHIAFFPPPLSLFLSLCVCSVATPALLTRFEQH